MSKESVYTKEVEELERARAFLTEENKDAEALNKEYSLLLESYEDTVGQLKLITKVSDKLQHKIDKANQELDRKNKELQETLDALTKAQAGKLAATIILLLGLFLFILEEFFLEKLLDQHYGSNLWISLGGKGFIAVFLKMVERPIEKALLNFMYQNKKAKPATAEFNV